MDYSKKKMSPGVRIFGNALSSIKASSRPQKPMTLGLKKFENSESTSLESSPCPPENNRLPLPVLLTSSSQLREDKHDLISNKDTYRENRSSLQAAISKEEICLPQKQSVPLNCSIAESSLSNCLLASADYNDNLTYSSKFVTSHSEPPSRQGNYACLNSTYSSPVSHNKLLQSLYSLKASDLASTYSSNSSLSHEEPPRTLSSVMNTDLDSMYSSNSSFSHKDLRQSLYLVTATDLCYQMSGRLPISTSDCEDIQDSDFLLSDDDNNFGETSSFDAQPFTNSVSSYHMANNPEFSSDEYRAFLSEFSVPEKKPEPEQVPDSLMNNRENRYNNRIQEANTHLFNSETSQKTLNMSRPYLPHSFAKYSNSEDSDVDVSMDEDLSPSPSFAECRSCEALSEKMSVTNAQKQYTPLPEYGRINFLSLRCQPGFIDSHCHLDFLLGRQNFDGTYTEYMQRHKGTYPASYEGCVAVFCHPHTFHKRDMWEKYLGEKSVWGAFGCHPHHSKFYNSAVERHLKQAIQHSKVRALGEIGLDYSNRNDCSTTTQHQVFRQQLKIALKEQLPLVIHCRDANEDTMRIMKEILPMNYRIHLHCFTDGWDWAQKWLKEFPNLCIGITNLVTFPTATPTHDVVKRIPLDRLLLETDAPYFVPRKIAKSTTTKYSHPGMAIHVAAQIAALRGVSLKEIIHHTRQNTKKVYEI